MNLGSEFTIRGNELFDALKIDVVIVIWSLIYIGDFGCQSSLGQNFWIGYIRARAYL